jgi:hypothetical protein
VYRNTSTAVLCSAFEALGDFLGAAQQMCHHADFNPDLLAELSFLQLKMKVELEKRARPANPVSGATASLRGR